MPAYRVRVEFVGIGGGPWLATHYMDAAATGSPGGAVAAVANFWGAVDALMDSQCTWSTLPEVSEWSTPSTVVDYHSVVPLVGTGSVSGAMVPKAAQALIRWRTSVLNGNRRVMGKTFVPALGGVHLGATGELIPASRVTLTNAAAAFYVTGLAVASKVLNTFAVVDGTDVAADFAVLTSRRD